MEVQTFTNANLVQIEFDGRRVEIQLSGSYKDGVVLRLGGMNCNLEGEMPGEYWLTDLSSEPTMQDECFGNPT